MDGCERAKSSIIQSGRAASANLDLFPHRVFPLSRLEDNIHKHVTNNDFENRCSHKQNCCHSLFGEMSARMRVKKELGNIARMNKASLKPLNVDYSSML